MGVIGLRRLAWTALSIIAISLPAFAGASEILVGAATISITPEEPVALAGQMRTRISQSVESPCTATALALESKPAEGAGDQAILVSCDLVAIRDGLIDEVRAAVQPRANGLDLNKIVLSATHTHTAPVAREGTYVLPDEGVMPIAEYRKFLVAQLADVIIQAWENRQPGRVGWGMDHAVIALNRRAVYANGTAQMYGKTDGPEFRGIEGYEDHAVEVLFFWNAKDELIATAINVPCPSQEVESRSAVNADFWHQVRTTLQERHGADLKVLGWTGASGDQSPHLMFRKAAEERMRELRGLDRLEELARRIVNAWEVAYEGAKQDIHADVVFIHKVKEINLPVRQVTQEEYEDAKANIEKLTDPKDQPRQRWYQRVVTRFESQKPEDTDSMELHAIRLGDIAIATNQFELFTDYGIQMKSRSKALQTFIIQLAGPGSYLPTERAVAGGGYSAVVASSRIGPKGGQVLVDETVELVNSLWE